MESDVAHFSSADPLMRGRSQPTLQHIKGGFPTEEEGLALNLALRNR